MADDEYECWQELLEHHREGDHFQVVNEFRPGAHWMIAAPHGGGMERGTTEIARAIAEGTWSFYTVDGRMKEGNSILHITSHNFDEPSFLERAPFHERVLGIHGCNDDRRPGIDVWVGGGDEASLQIAVQCLQVADFGAAIDRTTAGTERNNICNRGRRRGMQFELPERFRRLCFANYTRAGRQHPTDAHDRFVGTVRQLLSRIANHLQ